MIEHIPNRQEWNDLGVDQQAAIAHKIALQLPANFAFSDIRTFTLGDITQRVAMFLVDGTTSFSFMPGGNFTLGFDSSDWQPNADEEESWANTVEEYGIPGSLHEYVDKVTTARREVSLSPLLVESTASEVGWEPANLDDTDVKELISGLPKGTRKRISTMFRGGRTTRVTRHEDGTFTAEIANQPTHESLIADLQDQGFRYPTSDEWEYMCGAGSGTLFRWGNHVPCDRYPTDISPAESAWRRDWVLSGGKLEYPTSGFTSDWDYHRRPMRWESSSQKILTNTNSSQT